MGLEEGIEFGQYSRKFQMGLTYRKQHFGNKPRQSSPPPPPGALHIVGQADSYVIASVIWMKYIRVGFVS